MRVTFTELQFPKLFSFGVATKTGPNKKILDNSRMSLTVIGYGKTSAKPPTTIFKEIKHKANTSLRKTIIKVIFLNIILYILLNIYIFRYLSLKLFYIYRSKLKTQVMDSLVNQLSWEQ